MPFFLPYGKESRALDLTEMPGHVFLESPEWKFTESPIEIILKALNDPISTPSLSKLLEQKAPQRVAIILSDITRITGSRIFLPLLKEIIYKGAKPENVTWIIASGIHPPCSKEQLCQILGLESPDEITDVSEPYVFRLPDGSTLVQHNAKDRSTLISKGRIKGSEELLINRHAAEADFLILTGSISYHYLAGFGGGRKSVLPGISSYENCLNLHKVSIDEKNMRKHPEVASGKMCKNPLNKHIVKAVELVEPDFLLNTVFNEKAEMVHAVAGNWKEAFKQGRRFVKKYFSKKVKGKYDAAIVSCGGFPKDINFIQSHKTYENSINLVKEEGSLLLVAECCEGVGNPSFLKWFDNKTEDEFIKHLLREFEINGQTALSVFLKAKKVRTYCLTSLDAATVEAMNMKKVSSLQEFIKQEDLCRKSVAIVPYGSSIFYR